MGGGGRVAPRTEPASLPRQLRPLPHPSCAAQDSCLPCSCPFSAPRTRALLGHLSAVQTPPGLLRSLRPLWSAHSPARLVPPWV